MGLGVLVRGGGCGGFTLAAGQRPAPLGPARVAHLAGEGGVPLQQVAGVAVEGHAGAQLVVAPQPSAIHHGAGIETRLPQLGLGPPRERESEREEEREE